LGWTISYTDSALRSLKKMDKQVARRIVDFMQERIAGSDDPRVSGKALSGPLGGLWRYRVGDYRIICEVQNGVMTVLVLEVGNRKEVYKD